MQSTRKLVNWLTRQLANYNWYVLAGIVVLSVILGIVNNMRVYEEQRVNWFGGPVVSAEGEVDE